MGGLSAQRQGERSTTVMLFGKHKGCLLTEVPTSYLEWVCRTNMQAGSYFAGIAQITDELKRRSGSQRLTIRLEISPHAIERAGQRLSSIYQVRRKPQERLKAWLERVFHYVLKRGQMRKTYKSRKGVQFKQPRYEYFLKDSVRQVEWKFVTEGNDAYQKLVTVFAPDYTDEERAKASLTLHQKGEG